MRREKFKRGMFGIIGFVIGIILFGCTKDLVIDDQSMQNADLKSAPVIESANYYVAVNGNDNNPGTKDLPFATWQKAWSVVQPGQLVYIRGGNYRISGTLKGPGCTISNKSGTADKLIRIWAYPGEKPVFNLDNINPVPSGYYSIVSQQNANYCSFKGLRVTGLGQPTSGQQQYGWVVTNSSNNVWENCEFDHIGGYGFFVTGKSANNLILNCDAHSCADPYSAIAYGGSNGFSAVQIAAGYDNNVFRGCRAWLNSDDGFDTFASNGSIFFENCWAFWNGFKTESQPVPTAFVKAGDGDGFKLGNSSIAYDGKIRRTVTNCIAAHNGLMGFDQNALSSAMKIVNCTSYKNVKGGLHTQADGHANYFRNNLVYANLGSTNINSYAVNDHNSWNMSLKLSDSDFKSVDESKLLSPRNEDGSLPYIDFLRPTTTSVIVGKGTSDVGLTFKSASVDLGALQSSDVNTASTTPVPPSTTTPVTPVAIANYYIAPTGNDANPGTIDKPFKSFTKVWSVVKPGDLVYVRGGVYRIEGALGDCGISLTNKNGTPDNYIKLWAYPGETPVINLDDKVAKGYHTAFKLTGNYIHIKGLEICNTPMYTGCSSYGFIAKDCNNSIFEGFNTHHNQGRGFLLYGNSSNNTIVNCDSHHNQDPLSTEKYGNADGIAVGIIPAAYGNNLVKNCRSWSNSDDGFDTWGNEGAVTFENCWSFNNGYIPGTITKGGDGTGFKLGSASGPDNGTYKRILKNCLAYHNRQIGFSQNGANLALQYLNCTSYNNGLYSFHTKNDGNPHYFRNNIAYKDGGVVAINYAKVNDHNSWDLKLNITDNDFVSLDATQLEKARKSDGSLPESTFMKPKSTSCLVAKGVNVGITYKGTAPDLGAFSSL